RVAVAISGELGSGKSTLAKQLAQDLGARYFSTGDLQREIARRRGMTTLELNRISESDPTVDRAIDDELVAVASANPAVVLDSRMAWHFVPWSLKVYVVVDPNIAARRVLQ